MSIADAIVAAGALAIVAGIAIQLRTWAEIRAFNKRIKTFCGHAASIQRDLEVYAGDLHQLEKRLKRLEDEVL